MIKDKIWYAKIGLISKEARLVKIKQRHDNFVKLYLKNPKYCKHCNQLIPYKYRRNSFCNKSCAASYNNKKTFKPRPKCAWCNKPLKNINSTTCKTGKCKLLYNVQRYLSGEYVDQIPDKKSIRAYYIYIRGHKCEKCKLTMWLNKPTPLELHHKDGDSTNNSESNVELNCRNCHAFTDTFGSKNRGNSTRKRLYTLV